MHPPTRFECNCAAEYYGAHCENRYNDCATNTCGDHGFCVDGVRTSVGQKKYECRCEKGYELSSGATPTCVDIDECKNNPCYANVACINYAGGFDCKGCPTGMTGNGKYCEDINECLINNGGCSVSPKVQCRNKNPGFECDSCPSGYEGDGRYCKKASICDVQNGGCSPLATCGANSSGGVTCKCITGYTGNGIGPDGCKADGPTPTDCNINCNNGVCIIQNGKPECLCYKGFSGDACDKADDPCASGPCKNGGTCSSVSNNEDFTCQCTANWSGKTCTDQATECGGEYSSTTGAINYPIQDGEQYPANAKCSWIITVPIGQSVSLDFSSFDLETKHGSRCPDYLEIFDGESENSVGSYCGTTIPNVPDSTSNTYKLYFTSDSRNQATGFNLTWLTVDGSCGGVRDGTSGSIKSPEFPSAYPKNSDCVWYIDAPTTKVITIRFNTVDLYMGAFCEDKVKVFEGLSQDPFYRLLEVCASMVPEPVTTLGPFATISFISGNQNSQASGFDLSYTTQDNTIECGGDLLEDFGELVSPGYPVEYPGGAECVWKINVGDGDHIALSFIEIDLEDSYDLDCNYDFVKVLSGVTNGGAAEVSIFCGYHKADLTSPECQPENLPEGNFCRPLPGAIVSIQNSMIVEFRSDATNNGKGFSATYEIGCGGYFVQPTQITSPDYPSAYPKARECDYIIHADASSVVYLTFDVFALGAPNGDNCTTTYIKVFDGQNDKSDLLLTACENRIPEPILSSDHDLFLKFVTDGNPDDHGFLAHFDFQMVGCGGVYEEVEGIVRSPGYPMPYPNNLKCTWFFRAEIGFVIKLSFLTFVMEEPLAGECADFVQLYDGDTVDDSTLLGKFCEVSPGAVYSTGQYLTMYMETDFDYGESGFEASYQQIDAGLVCGGYIYSPSGSAASPMYPDQYLPNTECTWVIYGPTNNKIILSFTDFNLEYSDGCTKDYVDIRNGHSDTSPLIGHYCGHAENNNIPPKEIQSYSNTLWIQFHADDMVEDTGFTFSWDGTITGCGGEVTAISGVLHSPGYPDLVPEDSDCIYIIRSNLGSSIEITFDGFKIENSWDGACSYDFLQIFDGDQMYGPPITDAMCGEDGLNKMFVSNSSAVTVWLHTDGSSTGDEEGFLLHWDTSCENHISYSMTGGIQSHNYPGHYAPNSYCYWIVKFIPGLDINIKFVDVAIETCGVGNECSCDSLTIYSSDNFTPPSMLAKICGNSAYDILVTKETGLVSFVFESDDATEEYGFELEYSPTGGYEQFTDASGEFKTPQFDTGLQEDAIFIWIIEVPQEDVDGNRVELTVLDGSNMGVSQSTYVDCFNGAKPMEDKLIVTWTSKQNGQKAHSSGPIMLVMMVVNEDDYSRRAIKLSAKWTSLKGGECGGLQTSTTGAISSPNYPSNYPDNKQCAWTVRIPRTGSAEDDYADHIVFSFDFIDIENTESCWADSLEIFDGQSTDADRLGIYCGQTLPADTITTDLYGHVLFTSDSSTNGKGFHLTYGRNCGGVRNATEAVDFISSPNYPDAYWQSTECTWIINAANTAEKIFIDFTHFDLYVETKPGEPWENCANAHYLQIYESLHPSVNTPKYCGTTTPPLYVSHGSQVRVLFDATYGGENKGRTGFMATYTTSGDNCGGEFWSAEGNFMTPKYTEGSYPRHGFIFIIHKMVCKNY